MMQKARFVKPGLPRWHCLKVTPQSEAWVVQWLRRHAGTYGFFPVGLRVSHARGQRKEYQVPYLPGYVMARFPGEPVWHELYECCPRLYDVIRLADGTPAILHPDDLTALYAMRATEEAKAAAIAKARTIRRSDKARILTGLLPKMDDPVEVIEVRGREVVVALRFFGAERNVAVAVDAVEKVAAE